jgi:hypothetical protein
MGLGFDSTKSRIHARGWAAALFGFLNQLGTNAIKSGFNTWLFTRHGFESTLHGHIWRFDLYN